ncbi:MAG: hypothetical protein ACE5IK_11105 [Acidobacteriota bacterium]
MDHQNGSEEPRDALARLASLARPTEDCPAAEEMLAVVRAQLDADIIRFVGSHAMQCARCAEAWRLARRIVDGAPPAPEGPAAAGGVGSGAALAPAGSLGRWGGGAAVVAIAAIAAVIVLVAQRESSTEPTTRATSPADDPVRSALPADGILPRGRCVLRWVGPAAARYHLLVATRDGEPLHQVSGLRAQAYQVPPRALAGVRSGMRILWQVTAEMPDGRRYVSPVWVTGIR